MHKTKELFLDRILMDGIADMVFVIRVENESIFIYDFLNRAAMDQTGLTEHVLGKQIHEFYPQEMANLLSKQYMKVITSGESVTYEDTYKSTTGIKHFSETRLTPLLDDTGSCHQIVAVVKDISKEKRAELETKEAWNSLGESNKRYQSLFHHNSDAIISFDLDGHITDGNPAVACVTGYTTTELIGCTLNSLVVKEDINLVNKLSKQAASGDTENTQLVILNKNGDRIDLSFLKQAH